MSTILRKKTSFRAPVKTTLEAEPEKVAREPSTEVHRLFAICPGNLDHVLEAEIDHLGATILDVYPGGVEFEGTIETAYRACLSLRTASRVLLLLKEEKKIFEAEQLYDAIQSVNWTEVFSAHHTFAVHFTETQSKNRTQPMNPQFWALKAKDAIVDQFRELTGERPSVDRYDPEISIRLHLHDQILKIYLDLSGRSLHERGYRTEALEAPMKENLAAGLLYLARWDSLSGEKIPFYDPYCGSGTLLIEAGLIATDTAPGLFRKRFGFFAWSQHEETTFQKVRQELKAKRITDPELLPEILGSDQSDEALEIARNNIERAGLGDVIQLKLERFQETVAPYPKGLIVTNPPYGVRLEEISDLVDEYAQMGSTFKHKYKGWTCGVITSERELVHAIALKPTKKWIVHNGGLESLYSLFDLY
jgi:23S rRNA (guanine2445-N2)-methyltransferase / 23S rRNA (guanine2069-N7)-methyltransferase